MIRAQVIWFDYADGDPRVQLQTALFLEITDELIDIIWIG
jgi:hypothetical protein